MLVRQALYALSHLPSPRFDISINLYVPSSGTNPCVDLGLPVQWLSFSNIEPYSKPMVPPFLLADPESFSQIPFSPWVRGNIREVRLGATLAFLELLSCCACGAWC